MKINDGWITDDENRRMILRGVNLGGSSKVPFRPNGATHITKHFYEHRNVSFIGRPFPVERCDEHFERLSKWGFKFLRFVTTWEAIEHKGPGQYDNEYLDYLATVLEKAGQYGIKLFIDPHQDVWSRFTGGDGAPGWTLEAAGFNIKNFMQTCAAITHQEYGDPFPWFLWPSNGDRLASATMFTLFFAGNDFAPRTKIEDEPIQEYLQRHYISAMQKVAGQVKDMAHVIGFGTLNEPDPGWIGVKDLVNYKTVRRNGPSPSPWQSLLLASGYAQEVEVWKLDRGVKCIGRKFYNSEGDRAWLPGCECIWKENGVWGVGSDGQPALFRPDHFSSVHGRTVTFSPDYLRPFFKRYIAKIREVNPSATIFIDSAPLEDDGTWGPIEEKNMVYEPHWYDVATLALKAFKPWLAIDIRNLKMVITPRAVRRSLAGQLTHLKLISKNKLNNMPLLLGEMGIPFNLNDATAYKTGDFAAQEKAIDRCLRAVEDNLMSVTLWNYTADNDNSRGDQWNGEDFSIFSRDQQNNPEDINSGGRALAAILRPYPTATNGEPLHISYDIAKKVFSYKFRHDNETKLPTEIFVPDYHYPGGYKVQVSDGNWDKADDAQILRYWHSLEHKTHEIRISPKC